jgi:signal transduction histidine kinase
VSSYRTQLITAFAVFALLMAALYSLYALTFAYTVEDKFLEQQLRSEADRLEDGYRARGEWAAPSRSSMQLMFDAKDFPSDLRAQYAAHPSRKEFFGENSRHYHLLRLSAGPSAEQRPWLVWQAQDALIFRSMRSTVLAILGWSTLGALALAGAMAWWFGARYARGFTELSARLHTLTALKNPEQFVWERRQTTNSELHAMENSVEKLLAHIFNLLQREKEFTRDISHELRTPLAVVSSLTQQLHQRAAPAELPLLQSMMEANRRAEEILRTLLALARAEQLQLNVVKLLPLLEQLVIQQMSVHAELDVQFDPADLEGVRVEISETALVILLSILLSNALAHGTGQLKIYTHSRRINFCNPVSSTSTGGQAGFGLAIAHRISQRFGLALRCAPLDHDPLQWCASFVITQNTGTDRVA